jgi:hypothetical protein
MVCFGYHYFPPDLVQEEYSAASGKNASRKLLFFSESSPPFQGNNIFDSPRRLQMLEDIERSSVS